MGARLDPSLEVIRKPVQAICKTEENPFVSKKNAVLGGRKRLLSKVALD